MRKLVCLFTIFTALFSFGQETPFHYFTPIGKYNESIKCMAQDDHGRLLLGTQNGLIVYSGYSSRKAVIKGSGNKEITSIFVGKKNTYVLNAHGVPMKLLKDTLKAFASPSLKSEVKFIEIENDLIYFYTKKAVLKFNEKTKKLISSVPYLYAEENGITAKYFGTNKQEPYHVTSQNELILTAEQEARTIPSNNYEIAFGLGMENQIILASNRTIKGTLLAYRYGQFKRLNYPAKAGNTHINAIRLIHGQLMIFTDNGCISFSNGIKRTASLWFQGVACNDGLVDKSGNLWISTKSKGLILVPRGKHKKILAEPVSSVYVQNKKIFVGNNSSSILKLDKAGNIKQRISNEALAENISYTAYDEQFNAYFVQNGLIYDNKFVSFGSRIHGQIRTSTGELYLATSKGLLSFPSSPLKTFLKNFRNENYGKVLFEDECFLLQANPSAEQLLCASENGVFLVNNGELTEIKRNGKSLDIVSATWFDNAWYIITSGNSIYQISNGKVTNVRSLDKTGVVNPNKILGGKNHLYLLTESGLYRTVGINVPFESFRDIMGFDGLYIRDFAVINDEVYLATQAGLFTYLWKDVKPQLAQFVSGEPYNNIKKETEKQRFSSGSLYVPIECIDLSGNHNFHLQYRLINEGVKGTWVEVMPEVQNLALSNLANGKYVLEIRMIDPVSGLSTEIQRKKFEVPLEWWQLRLLWVGVGVALVLSIQWVMKKLRKDQPERKKKVTRST